MSTELFFLIVGVVGAAAFVAGAVIVGVAMLIDALLKGFRS